MVSITVLKHYDQKLLGLERVSFISQLVIQHPGKSRQEPQAGTMRQELAEGMEECGLLYFSLDSYSTQDYKPSCGDTHSKLDSPTSASIINIENVPHACLQAFSQMRFPLPRHSSLGQDDIKLTSTLLSYITYLVCCMVKPGIKRVNKNPHKIKTLIYTLPNK